MRKRYLILFAVISILLGIYFLFRVYENVEQQSVQQLYNEKVVFAKQAARGIESFFNYYNNSMKFLAELDGVAEMNRTGKERLKQFFESHNNQITAVTRVSRDGKLQYTYPENPNVIGADLSGQEHNRYLLENKKPTISDVLTLVQGYKAVVSVFPVYKDGEFDGGISVIIPFSYLARNFLDRLIIGAQGEAFVISKNGTVIFSPHNEHISLKYYKVHFGDSGLTKLFERMSTGQLGVFRFEETEGESDPVEKHSVYYPVHLGGTFWSIAVVTTDNHVVALMGNFIESYTYVLIITTTFSMLFIIAFFLAEKKYTRKIRETEESYRILTEKTGQIFYEYDRNTKGLSIQGDTVKMFGFTHKEMVENRYKMWRTGVHPEDRPAIWSDAKKYKNESGSMTAEFRFRHKKGYYIYIENNSLSIIENDGKRSLFIGVLKDITERKRLEAELTKHSQELEKIVKLRTAALINLTDRLKDDIKRRQVIEEELVSAKDKAELSDRLKSEFLAQISHEIRTPINTIMNFVSLIKLEAESYLSPEVKSGFSSIDNATIRLLRTIDLVLDMSDVEAGTYESNFSSLNLHDDVISNLISEFKSKAEKKGLELKIVCDRPSELPLINLDKYTVS